MKIRDYDPAAGCAFQGDVAIVPIPADISIMTGDEIKPVAGRLILQEGEVTGHHHAIAISRRQFRQATPAANPDLQIRDTRLRKAFAGGAKIGSARLYRDPRAIEEMRRRGILDRTDLAIGCLVIEGGSAVVRHEEHDGARLPAGNYYVGRQVESVGAEERMVAD